MLANPFDRFYVVTKFVLPSIQDLNFLSMIIITHCAYLDEKNSCDAETKKVYSRLL